MAGRNRNTENIQCCTNLPTILKIKPNVTASLIKGARPPEVSKQSAYPPLNALKLIIIII